jgi:hypothetical protein
MNPTQVLFIIATLLTTAINAGPVVGTTKTGCSNPGGMIYYLFETKI